MAGDPEVAAVIRMAAALALAVLVICACAPAPVQEAPQESPSPAGESGTGRAEAGTDSTPQAPAEESTDEPTDTEPPVADEPAQLPPKKPEEELADQAPPEPETTRQPQPSPQPPAVEERSDISGRITLVGGDADPSEAVVYFMPHDTAARDTTGQGDTQEIVTRDKTLSPTVLAVSRGTELRFPNEDPILHNLFSVSPENAFDVGIYGPDESPAVRLEHPGVVNIYCNVHHDMHAHVLVVDTPWRTRPDAAGNFRLTDLPAGDGELHIWHRQSDRWSRALELPASKALEATLEVTRPKLPPHRDKTGQPYNRRDRDPYR